MRRAAPYLLMTALAAVIALLILNFLERDFYEGSPAPLPFALEEDSPEWLPGLPGHKHEIFQSRVLRLRDRDGWYRLFWAGDEFFWYDDGVTLAADLWNRTACDPYGEWTIEIRCSSVCAPARLRYLLQVTDDPALHQPPTVVTWFIYRYEKQGSERIRHFWWKLAPE